MFYKIIFVLATVCVINASVISDNVFDDDPETAVTSNPKGCNIQACHQLCRRIKSPGGACVNGRCKCDKFLNAEDEVSEKADEVSDLDSVLQTDDFETELSAIPSRCTLKTCDPVCRSLNKTSGSCVDGRCKCAGSIVAEDADIESNVEDSVPTRACNNKRCHQLCRKKKFRGGSCLGANCYCHKFLSLLEDTMTDPAESLPLSSCNSLSCYNQCRRTGWLTGICFKGQCKCNYFLNTEVSENPFSNLEDSASPRKCNHQECNAQCRKLLFREGVCIAGRCSCNNYIPIKKDTMNDLEESISLDDNFLTTEDDVSEESLPVSDLSEDQTERVCNIQACDQLCRRRKFLSGSCVNGRCKCNNFFGTEDADDEYSEFASRRRCRLRRCKARCTRRGYEGAACGTNGRCRCYNNTQGEDVISETSLPVSEVSEDQSKRSCNMQACNELCLRLKFSRGACVNGRCNCKKLFGTEDAVDEYSELPTRRICNLTRCNRTCTRRGYESARCVYGWCKCYNKKIQRQDASPLNDVPGEENEESNIIFRTTEEEQTVPSLKLCNIVTCDQKCRRRNYRGGWCRINKCKCF